MKSTLFLAFFIASALSDIRIFPSNSYTAPNVRTEQAVMIQNNAPNYPDGRGIITNVTFEVYVVALQPGALTVDYNNPKPFCNSTSPDTVTGAYVGAIAGGTVNGTASWFLTASFGKYIVIYYARYIQNGRAFSAFNFSYVNVTNTPPSRSIEEDISTSVDNSRQEVRDGSNSDLACAAPPGGCSFSGTNEMPTWNKFSWRNTPAVFGVTYQAVCNDTNVPLALYTQNATTQSVANGGGSIMFTISGRTGSYTATFTLKYKKSLSGPQNNTWISPPYVFRITPPSNPNGTEPGRRDVNVAFEEQIAADFDAHLKNEMLFESMKAEASKLAFDAPKAKEQQTVSVQFAVGAAVAGVALVASIGLVIIAVVLRSKKQSNPPVIA